MKITDSIKYAGVNDHKIDLFEGQFQVPLGMAYNSYVIVDEKIAVMDAVDEGFGAEWLENIKNIIGDRTPDYLVVHHMEMDHSANILKFMETYPEARICSSRMAFTMMKNMFGTDFADRQIVAAEGTKLALGNHELTFIAAPNVHWPEVLMSYESSEKVLFAADGFGKFGANDVEDPEGWACEARRYYFGIVGKFGDNVQTVLKKAALLDIKIICSLHGPVLDSNIEKYIEYYNTWSSYGVESEGVVVAYTSVYGHTKKVVEKFAEILKEKGCPKVVVCDLAREDTFECVEDAFRYGRIVLASTTYNGEVFPIMRDFINHLKERNYQNKKVGFIENCSWAPMAVKTMKAMVEPCKNMVYTESSVSVKISMTEENVAQLEKLADEILA